MPTKAITQPPESRSGGDWRTQSETAPSLMRNDDPTVARFIGLAAGALVIFGGLALMLQALGRVTPMPVGLSTFLLSAGIAGLLFHAAFDSDVQFRRIYMVFGYVALIIGVFLMAVPHNGKAGALFGHGFLCVSLGLLFLLAFLRNETDEQMRTVAQMVIGAGGGLMGLVGFVGGNIKNEFLTPIGALLAVLGIVFLTAFVITRGVSDDRVYLAGRSLGAVGALVFLIALGRSLLPPLFYAWHWRDVQPPNYLVPYGLLLMALGALYVCISLLLCSERPVVVLTRRELGSLFYSPIAYILLFVFVLVHWAPYILAVWRFLPGEDGLPNPIPEPIVRNFILQWPLVILTIVAVPVLTMRLLSEEKRAGTIEVLLTAPVDEGAIIMSKFLASCIMFLTMWVPFGLFLVYLRIGGESEFDYRPLFSFAIGLVATAAAFISMGIFFSSLTRSQVASGVLTGGGMITLTLLFMAASMVNALWPSSAWVTVLKHMSYLDVWIETLKGRLIPRQLIFFISMTVVWLFVSVKVLEARKWA